MQEQDVVNVYSQRDKQLWHLWQKQCTLADGYKNTLLTWIKSGHTQHKQFILLQSVQRLLWSSHWCVWWEYFLLSGPWAKQLLADKNKTKQTCAHVSHRIPTLMAIYTRFDAREAEFKKHREKITRRPSQLKAGSTPWRGRVH